jgi:hypothetical protein
MARISLAGHWKFRRLVRAIAALAPEPDRVTGATPVARGLLELLWEAGYAAVSDYVGTPAEVATIVDWRGDPLVLVTLLVDAGFLDERAPGEYAIHDLWEHAPRYAQLRRGRKRMSGQTSDLQERQTSDLQGRQMSDLQGCTTQTRPDQGVRKSSAAGAARSPDEDEKPDARHIIPLGYELVRQGRRFETEADCKEGLKEFCVRYGIPFDTPSITEAMDLLKHAKVPLFTRRLSGTLEP